jgi:hypothetical protein
MAARHRILMVLAVDGAQRPKAAIPSTGDRRTSGPVTASPGCAGRVTHPPLRPLVEGTSASHTGDEMKVREVTSMSVATLQPGTPAQVAAATARPGDDLADLGALAIHDRG